MSWTLGVADGDLDVNAYGRFTLVAGRDKASQDMSEMLLSYYEDERSYGSRLQPGVVPPGSGSAFVASELHAAVDRLQQHQNNAANSDSSERIAGVDDIEISGYKNDPTSFWYRLVVSTEAGETATAGSVVQYRQMRFGHLS